MLQRLRPVPALRPVLLEAVANDLACDLLERSTLAGNPSGEVLKRLPFNPSGNRGGFYDHFVFADDPIANIGKRDLPQHRLSLPPGRAKLARHNYS